jgi:hypothetical protein
MASLNSDAGDASRGTPPFSRRVETANTGDCPNFFSSFIWDVSEDFSEVDSAISANS